MNRKLGIVAAASFLILALIVEAQAKDFDITAYNAKPDGAADSSKAFLDAWTEACAATEPSSLIFPAGTFLVNPVRVEGPCKAPLEIRVLGTIQAPEDHKIFKGEAWFTFHNVDGLTITGGGTFDAMGSKTWSVNNCYKTASCEAFPNSFTFNLITNSIVQDITSKDSQFFHINVIGSKNFTFQRVRISAPGESHNTDGIHIGRSTEISVIDSTIATGDDCVSLGDGSKVITVANVTCGPGHGISVGSLGRYPNEEPVEGVLVKNCTFINTSNGVRVKTWPGSPSGVATDMHFEDLIMQNVTNPILIDQEYCPNNNCKQGVPSNIKISKVSFKNIQGTSALPLAVVLVCSKNFPCENVEVGDIKLTYEGSLGPITTKCSNVQPMLTGTQHPPICAANDTQVP